MSTAFNTKVHLPDSGGENASKLSETRHEKTNTGERASLLLKRDHVSLHKRKIWLGFVCLVAILGLYLLITEETLNQYPDTSEELPLSFSSLSKTPYYYPPTLNNGTYDFNSTVILISFDGFRADYLERKLTPVLRKFIHDGIRAEYMIPSFPSVTFPNHHTIITGLYPESHGMVGNEFFDPELKDSFCYSDPEKYRDPKWWDGEPLWVTAEKQDRKSGMMMWAGSEAKIKGYQPTYLVPHDNKVTPKDKVAKVMEWLDLPIEERPTFIAVYEGQLDSAGHKYGPYSKQLDDALKSVDDMVLDLLNGLAMRNLTDIVNVIIVSDHGMSSTNAKNLVLLDDFIDTSLIHPLEGFPLGGIRPYNGNDIHEIYATLQKASHDKNWNCYLRHQIPERFNFRASKRISPILCIPTHGWAFSTRRDFALDAVPLGLHGYDNLIHDMQAIFLARGPAFKHLTRENSTNENNNNNNRFRFRNSDKSLSRTIEPFRNVEVYNIIAKILGLVPAVNNGTFGGII
ncbi:11510_t:CDS:2 [Ambispora gerdemannii]|uniref:11510_t:CDS:1 n=1 Tax=Ambispora gerdemannii TaxID=144530 RepID=A0A9N9CRF7_9GLOM|nr:11510_t:CDS:2 [Ambispora gerdemannii]